MARRPALSSDSFLSAVFKPKSSPRPTGIRKSKASGNGLRKPARVKAFNNLDPLKQQIIVRAGNKESYLRGNSTLADSRQQLRPQAIAAGIAKPITPTANAVAAIVAAAEQRPEIDARGQLKGPINVAAVRSHVAKMSQSQKRRAEGIGTYAELLDLIDDTRDDEGVSPYMYK